MSKPLGLLLAVLCVILAACGAAPPPTPPSGPVDATVAGPVARIDAEVARPADDDFVEDGDPGPIPVTHADPSWGRRDAPVTIVEFAEFQCPFCGKAAVTIADLRRAYGPDKIRIAWKNNPLPFHPNAKPAAVVAMTLFERRGNDGFWSAHDAFFADQAHLSDLVADFAKRAGMSAGEGDPRAEAKIKDDMELAKQLGATGTPAFFVNGIFISGAQPYEKFAATIDAQFQKAAGKLGAGTPPRRVYAELAREQWAAPKPPAPSSAPADDLTVHRVPVGKSPVRGKATALVTIVEIGDFQCPFCGRVQPALQQVMSTYGDKVRIVWKHEPLPFHNRAEPAAEVALEVRARKGDAGFWRIHDALFADPTHLDDQALAAQAVAAGIDAHSAQRAIADHSHRSEIEEDVDLADDVAANGTPHFFINGRRLVGAQPFEKFKGVIDEELAKAEALVRSGVSPAQVYDRILGAAVGPTLPERKTLSAPTRDNPAHGPAGAKVTVQFFGDFQCPFTKRAAETIAALEKELPGKIRVVWYNHPLPMHQNAEPAAEAAMEAFRQKGPHGFWAMYDLLFAGQANPDGLERAALDGYAAQLGLDAAAFARALDTQAHKVRIDVDTKMATDAGMTGTPAFVINGWYVSGAQPLTKFKKVVRLALSGAK
jgi:protein-disulfide isomerase